MQLFALYLSVLILKSPDVFITSSVLHCTHSDTSVASNSKSGEGSSALPKELPVVSLSSQIEPSPSEHNGLLTSTSFFSRRLLARIVLDFTLGRGDEVNANLFDTVPFLNLGLAVMLQINTIATSNISQRGNNYIKLLIDLNVCVIPMICGRYLITIVK